MVVVHRFRWFGWFVLCVSVILGCYLMSSRVAAERNKLGVIEQSIASTQRDIRALETEFDTRGNLAQLQRWNGDTLKLSAPAAGQYVRDDAQLAQINFTVPATAQVQTAAAVIPSAPVDAPSPDSPVAKAQFAKGPARVIVAAAAVSRAARAEPAVAKAGAKPRAQTVAMLDRTIMAGSSLSDLMRRVRADGGRQ